MVYTFQEAVTLNRAEPYGSAWAIDPPVSPGGPQEGRSRHVSCDRRNQLPSFCNRRVAALPYFSLSNETVALELSAGKEITTCSPSPRPTSPVIAVLAAS